MRNQIPCSQGLLTFLCSHADPPSSSNPMTPPRWLVRCSRGRRWLGSPSPGSARSLVWDHRTPSLHLLAPTGPGVLFFTAKQRFWRHAPGVLARGLACAAAYVEDAPWAPVIGLVGSLIKHMWANLFFLLHNLIVCSKLCYVCSDFIVFHLTSLDFGGIHRRSLEQSKICIFEMEENRYMKPWLLLFH